MRGKNKQIIRNETHHAVEAAAAGLWQLGGGDGGQLGGGGGSLAEARLRWQWQRVGKRGDSSDFGGSGSALGSAACSNIRFCNYVN